MTLPLKTPQVADVSRELPFAPEELIYSRTDERGIIKSANTSFCRLSGYEWREIIGAPHRIIRHPDMPKGFFHIFWDQLKRGEPATGYVKNRSRDGSYYWVLANANPCDGGYFSIRVKACSPFFLRMVAEYAALVKREQQENLTAEASAKIFLARLGELGFDSFLHFMSHAAEQEVQARNALIGRQANGESEQIAGIATALDQALKEQTLLVARFRDLMLLPVNMRLVAARLEPQGGPISQISMNYKSASDEISARLASFVSGDANLSLKMAAAVRQSLVLNRCAQLQSELVANYDRANNGYDSTERRVEGKIMSEVEKFCMQRATEAIANAAQLAVRLNESSADVRRMILGLDTIRILGRVESRRDLLSESSMSATIDRIDSVQGEISASLKRLTDQTSAIEVALTSLRRPPPMASIAAE